MIRKRIQIDGLQELPKEKRPPENIIWDGTNSELENWLDRVFNSKIKDEVVLDADFIEG